MACIPKYVNELPISPEDKEKLAELHTEIWETAHDSKVFRLEKGELYAPQNLKGLNEAGKYVAKINDENGVQVAKLVKVPPSRMKLAINVEKLAPAAQPELPLPSKEEATPFIRGERANEMRDFSNNLLEGGQISDETAKVYNKMLSLPDEEVNNRIKQCE